jgi:hypothetical protein
MRFASRLLLAMLISSQAAILHAQAEQPPDPDARGQGVAQEPQSAPGDAAAELPPDPDAEGQPRRNYRDTISNSSSQEGLTGRVHAPAT